MKSVVTILAAIAIVGIQGPNAARAQQPDTIRQSPDTTKPKVDTTKKVRADSAGGTVVDEKPAVPDLRALGTVDGGVRLSADLSSRTLTVIGANGAIKTFNVAIGTPDYPTPTGSFTIRKIVWNPSWIPPDSKWARKETPKGPGEKGNPMKVAKIFFKEPDYYIHGTGATKSLGSAASHGCLRMHPDEIAELAQFLMQNGGQAREEGWFSRVIHMRWRTHTVYLSEPVRLTVSK